MKNRNANLDLLRAIAITLVVVYHTVQMWPTSALVIRAYTALGAYGVDLFFVLSGWLIGGLYWREHQAHGHVNAGQFIMRRILRTVPCYLVALLASWLAVRISSPERAAFDPAYLLFLQNYRATMPYFLVSWSLCIEEHFYLALPLVMLAFSRFRPALVNALWLLCLVPLVARAFESRHEIGVFGYPWTATHFRFEGLLAGVAAARLQIVAPSQWKAVSIWSRRLSIPALVTAIVLFFYSANSFYVLGLSLLSFGFLGLLITLVSGSALSMARLPIVKAVALASYSTYLTHALMIHLSRTVISHFAVTSDSLRALVFLTSITIGGGAFFLLVEKPSLRVRDWLVPARPSA